MRFEDLQVFAVIARYGNLHRAAEAIGTTQSALTKAVQRLEAVFDLALVNRSRRGIVLTEAGTTLLEQAGRLAMSVSDLKSAMGSVKSAQTGTLRLGVIPAMLEPTLIPLLIDFRRRRPQLHFRVDVQTSARLIASVHSGNLDLAVAFAPDAVPDELQAEHVGDLRYHIVGRVGHPLGRGEPDLAALARAEWLLPPRDVAMRVSLERLFAAADLPAPVAVVQSDTSTAWFAQLVRRTDIISAFTDLMMSSRLGQGLQILPFAATPLTNDLRLFFRRNAFMSPGLLEMRAALKASLRAPD